MKQKIITALKRIGLFLILEIALLAFFAFISGKMLKNMPSLLFGLPLFLFAISIFFYIKKPAAKKKIQKFWAVLWILTALGIMFSFYPNYRGGLYYNLVFIGTFLGAFFSIPFFVFSVKSRRFALPIYFVLVTGLFIFLTIKETISYFDRKVPVVYDGINIEEYEPFKQKIAKLPQKATLEITEQLPVLDGALALYPLYSAFATAVYPVGRYELYYDYSNFSYSGKNHQVHFTNTINAFNGLLSGRVDIAFLVELSEQQKEEAQKRKIELELTPIGKEAFVFFVNTHNPIDTLSLDQIRGIYSGKITQWEDLGGSGEIKAFQRNQGSGSQSALEKIMKEETLIEAPKEERRTGMGRIIRNVADYKNYKNAIGFSFRYFTTVMAAEDQIKLLKINGIAPTAENIVNGTYPLISNFYAVTRRYNTNPHIRYFIDWIRSEQGQYLVKETGYVPIYPAYNPG